MIATKFWQNLIGIIPIGNLRVLNHVRVLVKNRRDKFSITGVIISRERLVLQSNRFYKGINADELITKLFHLFRISSNKNREVIFVVNNNVYDICGFYYDSKNKVLTILIH